MTTEVSGIRLSILKHWTLISAENGGTQHSTWECSWSLGILIFVGKIFMFISGQFYSRCGVLQRNHKNTLYCHQTRQRHSSNIPVNSMHILWPMLLLMLLLLLLQNICTVLCHPVVCVWYCKQYLDTDHGTRRPGLSDNSLLSWSTLMFSVSCHLKASAPPLTTSSLLINQFYLWVYNCCDQSVLIINGCEEARLDWIKFITAQFLLHHHAFTGFTVFHSALLY